MHRQTRQINMAIHTATSLKPRADGGYFMTFRVDTSLVI